MYLLEVVWMDVFPHLHIFYRIRNSSTNNQNMYFILIAILELVLHILLCLDLQTKSDLTIHALDVVENIICYVMLVVLKAT
jgi:hypothetical protein